MILLPPEDYVTRSHISCEVLACEGQRVDKYFNSLRLDRMYFQQAQASAHDCTYLGKNLGL